MRNSVLETDGQTDRQTERKVHLLSCASQLKMKTDYFRYTIFIEMMCQYVSVNLY